MVYNLAFSPNHPLFLSLSDLNHLIAPCMWQVSLPLHLPCPSPRLLINQTQTLFFFFLFSLSLPLQNSFHDNLIKSKSFYTTFNICAWSLPVGSHKLAVADMLHAHCLTVVKWKTHLTSDLSVLFFGLGTVSLHN